MIKNATESFTAHFSRTFQLLLTTVMNLPLKSVVELRGALINHLALPDAF
jgi:hypothetical protein